MKITLEDAINNVRANGAAAHYLNKSDKRYGDRLQFPIIRPRFSIHPTDKIFTIGSCFARNIEEKLTSYDVPSRKFGVPKEEWPARPNGVLNEYNAGTMAQRIGAAFAGERFSESDRYLETISPEADEYVDLMLLTGVTPTTKQRVVERRGEIDTLYQHLPTSDLVIITLGLTEAWWDTRTGLFLNRMPPIAHARKEPERYMLRRLDASESYELLFDAISVMIERGVKKIIVTVSPVPLQTTFSKDDALVANMYSKSALRVCAQRLYDAFPTVDYFPSYEMIMLGGGVNFEPDNVHVLDSTVQSVTDFMVAQYTFGTA